MWVGLTDTPLGVSGIGPNSFTSGRDLSEFLREWVGLDQIPLGVGGIKKKKSPPHTTCTHTCACSKQKHMSEKV